MTQMATEGQRELAGEADKLMQVAQAMVVNSDDTYQDGADFCSAMLRRDKKVIEMFRDPKAKAWEAHKAVCNAENLHLGRNKSASEVVAGKMKDFHEKREAELLEAERKERKRQEAQEESGATAARPRNATPTFRTEPGRVHRTGKSRA